MKTFHVGGINPVRRYKTLEAALKEAGDDDTIELHKNISFAGTISRNIILDGKGHTLTVQRGQAGLSCKASVVLQNLDFLCDPRSNAVILEKGGRLQNVTAKVKGPARVLFPVILLKGGKLLMEQCRLMKLITEQNTVCIAKDCTFSDYYGGVVHLPDHENLSVFYGSATLSDCRINTCWFRGQTTITNSVLGVFNTNSGALTLRQCALCPTVNEPAVKLEKEPSDGPLEHRNDTSKFALEQLEGACTVIGYTSQIPKAFVGFHIIQGSIEIRDTNNPDPDGYHLIRKATLSFVNTTDQAFYDTTGTTLSVVRSQINTSMEMETAMDKLDKLVGLKTVKQSIRSILNTVTMNQTSGNSDFQFSYHMIFAGDPGTGKTTVAKIVAQALFEIGAVPENKCTAVSVDSLVKGYVGQTAEHVRSVLDQAVGGVLFIDEAYELTVRDHQNSFNSEVLSVLIRYMEEHRSDLVVIAAGYEKEMREFLASNIGLSRRFQWIQFEDYTPKEMAKIFEQIRKSYQEPYADERLQTLIEPLFTAVTQVYLRKPDIHGRVTNGGNGGLVRNVFQQVLQARNNRVVGHPDEPTGITNQDLKTALRQELTKAAQIG